MAISMVSLADAISLRARLEQASNFAIQVQAKISEEPVGCVPLEALFRDHLPRLGGREWLAHQLKREGQVWHLVFTQKPQDNTSNSRTWLVATRHSLGRPEIYCVEGTGTRVDVLASLHGGKFDERFGMPGSNNPRCGNRSDPLEGVKVRGWASRELGDSLILSLDEPIGKQASFVLLLSKTDEFWILLDKMPGEGTCYRDRGQTHDARSIQVK